MGRAIQEVATALKRRWPGVAVAAAVGCAAVGLGRLEARLLGREWLEGLVLAILLGLLVRVWWTPDRHTKTGLDFAARPVLEAAIVLLGASVDGMALLRGGPGLLAGIAILVAVSISGGMLLGKLLGLPPRLAVLVACGNAICGNSAIAAVAPVVGAEEEQVASAVTFTALGSIAVVLTLPLLQAPLGLDGRAFGALAGMSVYAVPQVLAATAGAPFIAVQTATLVKLTRVLMLGPVTLWFTWRGGARCAAAPRLRWDQAIPPFILGFAALALGRSLGWVPAAWAHGGREVASVLTVVAMAALGLSSDPRAVSRAGKGVLAAATGSLLALVFLSWTLIRLLNF